MANISGTETNPEIEVRKFLFSKGFRFRKNDKKLPGKPDIVLPKLKTTIFVHGCFWHGHKNCRRSSLPSTNKKFWIKKINSNQVRDTKNKIDLQKLGYKVIIIWQCQISNFEKRSKTFIKLLNLLNEIH